MYYFLLFIVGALSGILGGMGMGGGTLLIPALTFLFDITQKQAQAINLICFIPMAVCSLFIHAKNHLVKLKGITPLVISASVLSVGASFLLKLIKGNLQTRFFGGFLCLLAIFRFISITKAKDK